MAAIASDDFAQSALFTPRERAILLWAEHVAKNTARERGDVYSEVSKHFNMAEVVELTGISGLFGLLNRLHDSLRLPVEGHAEIEKIKAGIRIDPARVKTYIEELLAHWPAVAPLEGSAARDAATVDYPPGVPASFLATPPCRVSLSDSALMGEAQNFSAAAAALCGGTTNTIRMWAQIPYTAKYFLPFQVALEREGAGGVLGAALKAMVLLRTGCINAAPYSIAHALAAGRAAGLAEAQLAAVMADDRLHSTVLSVRERAALLWAEHVAKNTAKFGNAVFDEVRPLFSDAELMELSALCALANMMDLMRNALAIPLETPAEIAALYRTTRVEQSRIKGYFETMVARWPREVPPSRG